MLSVSSSLKYAIIIISLSCSDSQKTCQPPDFPADGRCRKIEDDITFASSPVAADPIEAKTTYLPGDEVLYSCNKESLLMGNRKRTCTFSGDWTGSTPFCDKPLNISNMWVRNYDSIAVRKVLDGKQSTCYEWNTKLKDIWIHLEERVLINAIRIYILNSAALIEVYTSKTGKCGKFRAERGIGRWIFLKCPNNQTSAGYVHFRDVSVMNSVVYLCEVQIFQKVGCTISPNLTVTHGRFAISRKKSVLLCDPGYKATNKRMVCENNEWKRKNLRCIVAEEFSKPDRKTVVIVPVVLGVLLALLFATVLTVCLIRKNRNRTSVVVHKTSVNSNTNVYSEVCYGASHYLPMRSVPLSPPDTRPPFPSFEPGPPFPQTDLYGYVLPDNR